MGERARLAKEEARAAAIGGESAGELPDRTTAQVRAWARTGLCREHKAPVRGARAALGRARRAGAFLKLGPCFFSRALSCVRARAQRQLAAFERPPQPPGRAPARVGAHWPHIGLVLCQLARAWALLCCAPCARARHCAIAGGGFAGQQAAGIKISCKVRDTVLDVCVEKMSGGGAAGPAELAGNVT